MNFPKFDNRFFQPKKNSKTAIKNTKQLKDYSEEFRFIVGQNDYITKEFFQLLHDFRTRKVNPSNLELGQLNNPQKLYNYLRNHHWSVNIPEEFLIDWISMKLTGHKLSDIDISDFNHIFNKLGISYDFLKNIGNKSNSLLNTEKNPRKKSINGPSSITDFPQLKKYMLKRLEDIESLIDEN
ncbi:MAG: hypothetical protein EU529_14760 [Promethearchaeota archaeon]|nr:MAG: hypothetical protein EU529_14760 [Candidatus Lokiarchaeota archaeon]